MWYRSHILGVIVEFTPAIGIGAGDLQHAIRAEIDRIVKETQGNTLAQSKLLIGMLRDKDLINEDDAATVYRLAEIGSEAGGGKRSAKDAYFEARDLHNTMLARGAASSVALVLASSSVGSYSISENPDGSGGIVFAKSSGDWEGRGAAVGAIIGSFWGPAGAALGGLIGGGIGHAVDSC